jgi:hypothetical protein
MLLQLRAKRVVGFALSLAKFTLVERHAAPIRQRRGSRAAGWSLSHPDEPT